MLNNKREQYKTIDTAKKQDVLNKKARSVKQTRPSVRVNWVACLYMLHNTNLGGIESSPSPLLTSLRDHVRLREQACLQCANLFARTRR